MIPSRLSANTTRTRRDASPVSKALLLWYLECVALAFSYEQWLMATEEWRATTYDAYAAALDREQRAADHYALELHARRERLWCAAEPERRSREM